ncbi:MAG TPA: LemA family protein [Ignavibacteriales bacterium]|nr:LemA family protein [Ignavibacteriales bacterium]
MKKLTIVLLVLFLIFGMIGCSGCNNYNKFVEAGQTVDAKWAEVQSNYQRRADLIPNLVKTVEGAANFEKSTLKEVVEARAKATSMQVTPEILNNPEMFKKFEQVQGQLSSALSRLMVVVEKYPELKANENFLQLQAQLEGTENRIKFSRDEYSKAVREYNVLVKRFPAVIWANIFGFKEKPYFQAQAGAENAPSVNFNFDK